MLYAAVGLGKSILSCGRARQAWLVRTLESGIDDRCVLESAFRLATLGDGRERVEGGTRLRRRRRVGAGHDRRPVCKRGRGRRDRRGRSRPKTSRRRWRLAVRRWLNWWRA